jgi:hypothetical protein
VSGIVVYLDPVQGGSGSACFVKAPFAIDDPHTVSFVMLDDVDGLNGPDVIQQVGRLLASRIRENTAVKAALDLAFAQLPHNGSLPISFRVGDPRAHGLSWEALVGSQGFVALDARWPIARIARGGALEEQPRRTYIAPLRLVCVLSAVGIPAAEEWASIHAAVTAARRDGLPIEVHVLVGEESLAADITALADPGITVAAVPSPQAPVSLVQTIENLQPHLLHAFCHGSVNNGTRRLEFATVGDMTRDDGTSSVLVFADELAVAVARAGTWAVVLNTCRGAQASDEALTHAEQFVSSGVPLAIGMRRQIDVDDAVAFSGALYPEVFKAVGAVAAKGPGEHRVGWADTLLRARQRLRDLHGADPSLNDSWTMPVLYATPGDFTLVVSDAGETQVQRALAEAAVVSGLLAVLPESTPPALLQELRSLTATP